MHHPTTLARPHRDDNATTLNARVGGRNLNFTRLKILLENKNPAKLKLGVFTK